jgi:hypothetical protein
MVRCHAAHRAPAPPLAEPARQPSAVEYGAQPALRALLVLSGAVAAADPQLSRLDDTALQQLGISLALLARPDSATSAA